MPKVWSLSHCAAVVFNSALPNEIPTPKTMMVPQGIRLSASFQLITSIDGVNIIAKANSIMEDESIGWKTFSVDQNINNIIEMVINRHSFPVIGPISFNCC